MCQSRAEKKRTQEHHRFTFNLEPVRSIRCRQNQLTSALSARLREYEVIGRHLPTEANPSPALYRMTIFAPNTIVAKSRYWYFLRGLKKVKKATGEIVSVKEISEKHPEKVKNFGIWVRYDSRSGTHNMYKEYRELSRTAAVESLYSDMAARHRARFRSIHILRVVEIEKTEDVKRPYIKQLMSKGLSFPLPHRTAKTTGKKIFSAKRPSTFA
ncbi:60S ribosomal protein L20-A [Ceratocystis fimbriata CBS 114723]|uniref:60S ribosomal protein L20-A n=1 Tax=Ceratocystis fimbriata CBS 114723 TaxID=1035309 RepID=A0A2C5XGU6_9PEZI|nr:60S ribosomal protein L20-A [Ceratocystis fimbriata CBS 114723]